MSGGRFDYHQFHITAIADSIEYEIDGRGQDYSAQTLAEFKAGVRILRIAAIYANRIDYLLSDDDSEEGFLKRLAKDLDRLTESITSQDEPCSGGCGMNYCDDNGCLERKRDLVDPIDPEPAIGFNTRKPGFISSADILDGRKKVGDVIEGASHMESGLSFEHRMVRRAMGFEEGASDPKRNK